jgi:RNA polymerase sigma-70 factor (ECF subfamily)
MSEADEALIARVRQGDRDALVAFIELRRLPLLAFIHKSLSDALRSKVEAADILQEASLSALDGFDELDLSERDPFGWLCQHCERRIIDAHRKYIASQKRAGDREVALDRRDPQQPAFIDVLVASMTTPSKAFSRDQRAFRLAESLEQLSEESRTALRLRYVEGLSTKEIAERLDKSDVAVRVLLSRSLDRLQNILSHDDHFESFWTNR